MYIYTEDDNRLFAAQMASRKQYDRGYKAGYEKGLKDAGGVDVDKAIQFLEGYAFKDDKEVYTNGTILLPLFRVKQALIDKAYNGFHER